MKNLVIKIKKSSKMSTIKEEYIDENKFQDDAEVLEKFLSMKDAIVNLKLNDFENFLKKHT